MGEFAEVVAIEASVMSQKFITTLIAVILSERGPKRSSVWGWCVESLP